MQGGGPVPEVVAPEIVGLPSGGLSHYPLGEGLREYGDAEAYDLENPWSASDDFYQDLAGQTGGPVLDAGCGTGLLALTIARTGILVTGLDVTPEMI